MIIGGESIYEYFFPYARRLYLTYININIKNGDKFFPMFNILNWNLIFRKKVNNLCFNILERFTSKK